MGRLIIARGGGGTVCRYRTVMKSVVLSSYIQKTGRGFPIRLAVFDRVHHQAPFSFRSDAEGDIHFIFPFRIYFEKLTHVPYVNFSYFLLKRPLMHLWSSVRMCDQQ